MADKKNNINYEEEGVFYTPSKEASDFENSGFDDFDSFESYNKKKSKKKEPIKKAPKKVPPKKSQYPIFMSVALGLGVVVFVTLFVIVYNTFSSKNSGGKNIDSFEITSESYDFASTVQNSVANQEYLGVIKTKSDSFKTFTIYNVTTDDTGEYTVTGATDLRDKYGKSLTFSEISEGDLVDFVYSDDATLVSIKESDAGFSEKLTSGFKVDVDTMKISTGMNTYSYTENTRFIYNGEDFDPSFLDSSVDEITISGYGDEVLTVTLDKGHCEVDVTQNNKIKDGIIEIDTNVYKKLSDVDKIKLKSGKHKIVVKGSNIDSFTREIDIAVNEKYALDLNEIQVKSCKLTIRPNVTDYALYINGKLELSRDPLELEFGTYTIEVIKEGYVNYETEVKLNKQEKILNIQLTKEVKMGTLTVNSNPTGASILIDGASVGTTPYTSDVTQGQHSVTLKKEGYKDITIGSIYISDHEAVYNVELQKE